MAPRLPEEKWRRTGSLNVALEFTAGIVLLICLAVSLSQPGGQLIGETQIYHGNCKTSQRINTTLHLVINVISSSVLASSNYFMQVLSAPTRDEVNRAHRRLQSLDIGIPSTKNIFFISRFKLISYIVLFISSIPIHLFFNSSIFESSYQGTDWNLIIANEAFIHQAPFSMPGASLSYARKHSRMYHDDRHPDRRPLCSNSEGFNCSYTGFGFAYDEDPTAYLTGVQSQIANKDGQWEQLDAKTCLEQYSLCNPRTTYGDLVMVVNAPSSSNLGWKPRDVFPDFPSGSTKSWDPPLRLDELNSLWYTATCSVQRSTIPDESVHCKNKCGLILGNGNITIPAAKQSNPGIDQESIPVLKFSDPQTYEPLNAAFDSLAVQRCWSRVKRNLCKVRMSNRLILAVMLCFFVKAIQSWIVVKTLPDLSLITPGDALQSFITKPDPTTFGMCTLELKDSIRLEEGPRRHLSTAAVDLHTHLTSRKFNSKKHRLASSFPKMVWTRTYGVLTVGAAVLALGLVESITNTPEGIDPAKFGQTDTFTSMGVSPYFMGSLIFANSPQLLLSFCYFVYNAFFTRLALEREWNSYYYTAKPLRVSYPSGQQISNYRLQLPYSWSLPLIALSALLHWLLSNAIFVFVTDGGYWKLQWDPYVQDASLVSGVGFSTIAVILLSCVSFPAMALPLIFSLRTVKLGMVAGGSDSMVISAACHCHSAILYTSKKEERIDSSSSVFVELDEDLAQERCQSSYYPPSSSHDGNGRQTEVVDQQNNYDGEDTQFLGEEEKVRRLHDLAISKVRWGAMRPTPELLRRVAPREGEELMHLGFGGEDTEMHEPRDDEYYA